jgi:hypothetical protein
MRRIIIPALAAGALTLPTACGGGASPAAPSPAASASPVQPQAGTSSSWGYAGKTFASARGLARALDCSTTPIPPGPWTNFMNVGLQCVLGAGGQQVIMGGSVVEVLTFASPAAEQGLLSDEQQLAQSGDGYALLLGPGWAVDCASGSGNDVQNCQQAEGKVGGQLVNW